MISSLIIGVGNPFRCDDAAGLAVAQKLCEVAPAGVTVLEQSGEGTALMDAWTGFERVILVDAARSGAEPGTIHRFDASAGPLPASFSRVSTHAFGVAEAVEMARQLENLPPILVVYAIEGKRFDYGRDLSLEVQQAIRTLIQEIQRDL